MSKIDISEYDSKKKYPPGTEFILDDKAPNIPVPEFLKKKEKDDTTGQYDMYPESWTHIYELS